MATNFTIYSSSALVTNATLRQWPEIRQSLYATHISGFFAFLQLGIITHRNERKWDRQNIVLPVVFCFFPLLYPCQIVVSGVMVVRNRIWRPGQGLNYYVCGILGMYAAQRSCVDSMNVRDETSGKMGPGLLLDIFKPRALPYQRQRSGRARLLTIPLALLALYQATSTFALYVHRWTTHGDGILEIEHRTGLMATGAAIVSLAILFFEITGFDWQDTLYTKDGFELVKLRARDITRYLQRPMLSFYNYQQNEQACLRLCTRYLHPSYPDAIRWSLLPIFRTKRIGFERHSVFGTPLWPRSVDKLSAHQTSILGVRSKVHIPDYT